MLDLDVLTYETMKPLDFWRLAALIVSVES